MQLGMVRGDWARRSRVAEGVDDAGESWNGVARLKATCACTRARVPAAGEWLGAVEKKGWMVGSVGQLKRRWKRVFRFC